MSTGSTGPDRYALMGFPIGHSWSPFIHGMFAKQTEQNLSYKLVEVKSEQFRGAAVDFFANGGAGLNITVPHKQAAAELANRLTARALRAGAVNTLVMEDNELLGENTDGAGLIADLQNHQDFDLGDKRILILGAGGATRGILAPLLEERPAGLVLANRTARRATELAAEFSELGEISGCGFSEVNAAPFDLIINATSASLQGDVPPISPATVNASTLCYDLAYGKGDTSFTRWAREAGADRAVKGWGMLVEQAALSFELWRKVRPETATVLQVLNAL